MKPPPQPTKGEVLAELVQMIDDMTDMLAEGHDAALFRRRQCLRIARYAVDAYQPSPLRSAEAAGSSAGRSGRPPAAPAAPTAGPADTEGGRVMGWGEPLRPTPMDLALDQKNTEIARLRAEVERLTRWKAEATEVIGRWDLVYEALGQPGRLGERRADASREEVCRLLDMIDQYEQRRPARHGGKVL